MFKQCVSFKHNYTLLYTVAITAPWLLANTVVLEGFKITSSASQKTTAKLFNREGLGIMQVKGHYNLQCLHIMCVEGLTYSIIYLLWFTLSTGEI